MFISTVESMFACTARGNTALAIASALDSQGLLDSPTAHEAERILQQQADRQPPTAALGLSAFSEQPHAVDDAGAGVGFDDDDNSAQPLGLPSPPYHVPPQPDFHPPPPLAEDGGAGSHTSITPSHLPEVVVAPRVALPAVVSLAKRPGPPLPRQMADGEPLPTKAFNPFEKAAPRGTWKTVADSIPRCVRALLGRDGSGQLLMIHIETITSSVDLDARMCEGNGYDGFCIYSDRDVLLCGLRKDLARATFVEVARLREASSVLEEGEAMEALIRPSAKRLSARFTIEDDYTTGFGYSTAQLNALGTAAAPQTLARAIARGGLSNLHFRNVPRRTGEQSVGSSRAELKQMLQQKAREVSSAFREWEDAGRPRVTKAFRTDCEWVRAPFVLRESLPLATDKDQIRLAGWETTLRGIEEHLMLAVFGSLPNVTWARILSTVMEKAEAFMDFDVRIYRQWAAAPWEGAHAVGPGQLGCPWKHCGSRLLPKGACGISPSKPFHDDDNAMISLGCWTSITEADTPTNLVFLINGCEVVLHASAFRSVLFMGYIPHETRPADPSTPPSVARVHHSAFAKPEAEHLAAHILSNLPCRPKGGDWSMTAVHRLRRQAFWAESMQPILRAEE